MKYLNIDNIRVQPELPINNTTTGPVYDALANAGFDFNFLMRREFTKGGESLIDKYVGHFKNFLKQHPGSIKSIEGINEVGNPSVYLTYEGFTQKKAATEYQKDLYVALNSDAMLQNIPLYNFTVWYGKDPANYIGYENVSNFSDAANAHIYIPTNLKQYYEMTNRLNTVKLLDNNSPNVMTETGYPSSPIKGNSMAVPQEAQAKLVLNMIMDAYDHDVKSVYVYELFDFFNDRDESPSQLWSVQDQRDGKGERPRDLQLHDNHREAHGVGRGKSRGI